MPPEDAVIPGPAAVAGDGTGPAAEAPALLGADVPLDLAPLSAALSAGALVTDDDVVAAHAEDRARFCPAGRARGLVRAKSVEDVQATLRFAHEHRVPVVPQGARTGLSGAANAVEGCLLLSVAGMDRVLHVDEVEKTVRVEPGVINQDLKDHLKPYGLSYPPDPGSVAISTIGGNVATNAGGLCCVKYGVTRDYVRALRVVLADGSLTTVGRPTAKGVAGLELGQLFVGSEGTLGVVVEVLLELVPALPDPITGVALFADPAHAAATVTDFMGSGARPALLELLDGANIRLLSAFGDFGLDESAGAMLLVQSNGDGSLEAAAAELESFTAIARDNGATEVMFSEDPADAELLIVARRSIGPAGEKFCHENGYSSLVDDICIPRARLAEYFARQDALQAEYPQLFFNTAAHAGDGNLHPCVMFPQDDAEAVAQAQEAFGRIMQLGLELGGTITGEHGVGALKAPWLGQELDEANRRMHRGIKQALDPRGILNPGKMLSGL
ncbi:FAD-binding oxidoreductase [Brevibacterium litoralis]|uniref:FAD-binding oxidoreductase n=1 Tax=Brevibacterium litoralis TaxID=3138935 RepID=UPI0032EAA7AF